MSAEQKSEKRGMTLKEFFKSTAFKCIIVLLAIVLICGILLTICNTLFYVSDEERFARALNKIYGYEVTTEEVSTEEFETSYTNGTVNSAYYVTDDGNYLVNVTGTNGYQGGTVTCWVVVVMTDGAVSGVGNVVIDSNSGQSYISKVSDDALAYFGENYESGGSFAVSDIKSEGLTGGATYSMTAIVNAVNTALEFVRSQLATGSEEVATDAERLETVIAGIYEGNVTFEEVDITELTCEYDNGTVNSVFELSDGNYIVNATGTGGFPSGNGTVTCWIVVEMTEGKVSGIGTVAIDSNENQSWIGNITDETLAYFEENYSDGGLFNVSDWGTGSDSLTGGATLSTTAIVNSVNTALQFARAQLPVGGEA